jgi:monothiol glutaredoxin
LPTTPSTAPKITVTDEAAGVLRHALQGHEDQDVHLTIDAQFRNSLALGPRQDDEVVVESNGITLLLDRDSVTRADGATLQVLRTERGPELSLINPNVPAAEPAPNSRG